MTDLPSIKTVETLPEPYRLRIAFRDGRTADVDLQGIVHRYQALAPVRDPERFRAVRMIRYGHGITWGNDLDVSADTLSALADAQAPFAADDFRRWQETARLSNQEAADVLGLSIETIKKYRAGSRIPAVVALACRATQHAPALLAARFRPRRAGRPRKAAA
ncbi:MAG: DUF2442 domain-containing protein [Rhodospirillales bacterium]|nr:DUF2442 domain-containing protein [Rhodospirillales bacterium]